MKGWVDNRYLTAFIDIPQKFRQIQSTCPKTFCIYPEEEQSKDVVLYNCRSSFDDDQQHISTDDIATTHQIFQLHEAEVVVSCSK